MDKTEEKTNWEMQKKGNWGVNCCRKKVKYEGRNKWAKEGKDAGL